MLYKFQRIVKKKLFLMFIWNVRIFTIFEKKNIRYMITRKVIFNYVT